MRFLVGSILVLVLTTPSAQPAETFDAKVHPILKANCVPCHNEETRTSGFSIQDLNSVVAGGAKYGASVKPGLPAESPLIQVLRGEIKPQMPFGKKLAESDIAAIEHWVRDLHPEIVKTEAQKARYWAFVKPARTDPPAFPDNAWIRNEIDNFILKKLQAKGLSPAKEANRRILLRRLYFDLIGLPPTPDEIKTFLNDASPKAYEEVVERLLQDPRYGERWGRYWLDLARYSDTNGYEGDAEYPHAWRYRDYVIDAFNHDKPYDEFVKEQIAGDEFELEVRPFKALPTPDPEKMVALTFLRLAPFTEPRGEEDRDVILSEMTSTVGSVFLGLTVGCAKCHDHKYDMIPIKDFYRMKAFFATVQIARPAVGDIQQLGGPQPAEFYRPGEKEWADRYAQKTRKHSNPPKRNSRPSTNLSSNGLRLTKKPRIQKTKTRKRKS